jgi:small ligand-binding sensory domain FIST
MLTAYTREIDDLEVAVNEILEQLNLNERLLRHGVGILSFHPEFLDSGAVRAVSEALPFDSIGGTTCNVAVNGVMGDLMLALTVLTSDDIVFKAGASLPIEDDPQEAIKELYSRLVPPSVERPSLLFTVAPVVSRTGGDDFIEALDAVSGGVPLFGSMAFTYRPDFGGIETCWNGSRYSNVFTLIAMFGEVKPEFYLTVIPESRVIQQNAIVTQAVKNKIQSINGQAPLQYLEYVGMMENGSIANLSSVSIPFVLTLTDGSQMVRSAYGVTEEGYILAFGTIPVGAQIGFSDCDADFVLQSATEAALKIADCQDRNALIISCAARRWTLGIRTDEEIKELAKLLDGRLPYQFSYSGGEICPVINSDGQMVNSFHNFSLIACLL